MTAVTMQRAVIVALPRSAGALRRNNNAMRCGAAARHMPAAPRRQRVLTQAAVLPTAVKAVADMVRTGKAAEGRCRAQPRWLRAPLRQAREEARAAPL